MKYLAQLCLCLVLTGFSMNAPAAQDGVGRILNELPRIPGFGNRQQPAEAPVPKNLPPSPLDGLASDDMKISVVTGGMWGALAGAAAAKLGGDEDEMTKHVLIGVGVGVAAGAVAGSVAKQRRAAYESEAAYLDAEIESANKAIDARSAEIAKYEKSIADTEKRVAKLESRHERNNNVAKDARKEQDKLQASISQNEKVLAQMDASIEYLDDTLEESKQQRAANHEEKQELLALQTQLMERRTELKERYDRLHGANQQGMQLAARLGRLTGST